ncbi:MAG: pseudouridine-5'-phosphate glycosidase [Acidimicrobiia bacterium]|nr:pseudouridine-5'-phosphate glycosidase [Acidimicrobiia bacterium]
MLRVGVALAEAIAAGTSAVALESTIFSNLGLPSPANREALNRCTEAVRSAGAEPALTAVLNGAAVVGVEPEHFDTICGPARKVAERDLAVAVSQGWVYGATTVSASMVLAAAAGVEVFATGGLGGVHRDVGKSMDVSSDLRALSSHPVVAVSSGAKVFLDLARTLEYLETSSVPVLGFRCDEFPAFYARSSGLPVPHRVESPEEVASIARYHWDLGGAGLLVVNPVPEAEAIAADVLDAAVVAALRAADRDGVVGAAVTPMVLAEIARLTEGQVVAANLALAESNAAVAAEIAVALMAGRC